MALSLAVTIWLATAPASVSAKPPASQPGAPEALLKSLDSVLHDGPFKSMKDTRPARGAAVQELSITPDSQAAPPDGSATTAEKQAFVDQMAGMLMAFHADPPAVTRYLIDANRDHPLAADRLELLDHLLAGQVTTLIHAVRGSSR